MTTSRRTFLRVTAAAAGAAALPACTAARAPRRPPPGERLRLLVIGVGGRGHDNLRGVASEDITVLCDVDRTRLAAAQQEFPAARAVADFRAVLLDAGACAGLDGVVISTPDHSHFLPALLALQQGLDVYCEKPLTHNVAQARRLAQVAERNGCVTQLGTQIHANANYRRVVEAIGGGAVGPVREVWVFVNGTDWSAPVLPPEQAPPDGLDYELWLGPVAGGPYRQGYHPAGWRRFWAFGGGTTADMSCHFTDLAFWALGLDAPIALTADGSAPHAACAPRGLRCTYEFAARGARPPLLLHWHAGGDRPREALAARGLEQWRSGVLFVGDEGWLISDYDRHVLGPAARAQSWQRPPEWIPPSPGHHREWIDCCKARTQPSCCFAYGGPLTEHVLLANVAFRAAPGRRLCWDAAAMRSDDAAANGLLDEPSRAGFAAGGPVPAELRLPLQPPSPCQLAVRSIHSASPWNGRKRA